MLRLLHCGKCFAIAAVVVVVKALLLDTIKLDVVDVVDRTS
jgi:hypothetical protein